MIKKEEYMHEAHVAVLLQMQIQAMGKVEAWEEA